ncbi:hypothetical protein D8I35_03695 [Corticibacter populi]|uniref:Uncharacterized protein n=1 Tax=Corticibacter populi TaxID=1550736 RepID=A0A3M6QYY4_9BURK|nr:hypothetical protein [Corticibacter populi]RMX08224.1 hypothetical protein D8I35_03695 [Corticibacter populi]RZS35495.1 hypothetical protein EV687_0563 [Corticibacter populi]
MKKEKVEGVVLDDGLYYAVLEHPVQEPDQTSGFLHVRRWPGCRLLGEDECVGSVLQLPDLSWEARLFVGYDDETNSESLMVGQYDLQLDALVALWQVRRHGTVDLSY